MACAAATPGTTATSPNNRKHLTIVRMVTSWRLVASLSYRANDGTYQRQSRLLSRVTDQVVDKLEKDSRFWRGRLVRAAATESTRVGPPRAMDARVGPVRLPAIEIGWPTPRVRRS